MNDVETASELSESQFATLVDELAADPTRREQLVELLSEDHPAYDQRGAATIVRMRGWALLSLARAGVTDAELVFVLEELDTGIDPYLVAAAARVLRSFSKPTAALAPFVLRAITHIRYRDEPVSFEGYGEYGTASSGTTALGELLATLAWLGPMARGVLAEVEALHSEPAGLSKKFGVELRRAIDVIRSDEQSAEISVESCCTLPAGLRSTLSWARSSRRTNRAIEQTTFQDQDGESISFKQFFSGHPTIVVFFYTRCDNPLKCSLTVTKLARIQKMLEAAGLDQQIHTAAISYDPEYDLAERIRVYGRNRGVRMDAAHRMLRAPDGIDALRKHFNLGVNFIESLVNRHRVEAYVLDADGRIASSFERLHWEEQHVVDRAVEVLNEQKVEPACKAPLQDQPVVAEPREREAHRRTVVPFIGTLASLAVAFFPKCPVCWAAYMSMFGIAGLNQIPYSPWLQPVLVAVMLINLASVWFRARSTGRMVPFYLVSAGVVSIIASRLGTGWEGVAVIGLFLTLAGSLLSALSARQWSRLVRQAST